jgi:hypothetical protein
LNFTVNCEFIVLGTSSMEHFQRSISDQFFGNFGSWRYCCNFTSCIWVWPYLETHIQFLLASAQPHQLDLQRSADGSGASMKPINQPSGWQVCNIDFIKKTKFSVILLLLLHTFAAGIFLSEEHPTAEDGQFSREL